MPNKSKYNHGGVKAPNITPRRLQLMELVACGMTDKAIAAEMGVKKSTVHMQIFRLYNITGSNNKVQLTLWYLKNIKQCQHC